jgi:serine-type D-Ala-D-Ala carboxypeptidase/endopeptidase (penicillin-binding protein 4)
MGTPELDTRTADGAQATAPRRAYGSARRAAVCLVAAAVLGAGCAARLPPPLTPPPVVEARDRQVRQLQQDIGRLLESPLLSRAHVGAMVASVSRGDLLFQYNPDRLLMPASNQKLLALAVAAERLGWDFTFETRIHATAPLDGEVLHGDLLIVGSGDPSITTGRPGAPGALDAWADALWTAGLRRIEGRLIGIDNAFDPVGLGAGWSWDDLQWYYASRVGALQVNENAVSLVIGPGDHVGAPAVLVLGTRDAGLELRNQAWTAQADARAELRLLRYPGSPLLTVAGSVPLGSAPLTRRVSVDNPTIYFLRALASALEGRGIAVAGGVVDVDDLAWPTVVMQPALVEHRSQPLGELALTLMKDSQNLYAETLLRTLGAGERTLATADEGRVVMRETLATWGLAPDAMVVADASGLSRYNFVTPRVLLTVLRRMHDDPRHRAAWLEALPVGGVDGTLARRFRESAASGRVRAKTGTLSNTRALSGYVDTEAGERLAFVVLVNNATAPARELDTVIDAVVERLAAFER